MKPWVNYFLIGLVAFIVGIAAAGGSGSSTATTTVTVTTATAAPSTSSAPAVESATTTSGPVIHSHLTCDYNIDTSSNSNVGGTFIAGGTVNNDGDAPATVTVAARWTLLGSQPARASKTIRLAPGGSREVELKVVGTLDQISAYQSGNTRCHVAARP